MNKRTVYYLAGGGMFADPLLGGVQYPLAFHTAFGPLLGT